MTTPNPFESIFDQIADLLQKVQKGEFKELDDSFDSEDIEKQLDEVEEMVSLFKEVTDEALEKTNLKQQDVQNMIKEPSSEATTKDKRFLIRSVKIRGELVKISRVYARKKELINLKKKRGKTLGKNRKKKFKRLGGQGWLPL